MTEVGVESAAQHGDNSVAAQPQLGGAGLLLRQAREQQHMSVEGLASALKVPVYKLQALESERWDILTDSVFARALALSICRLLRIPAEPVLAGMPRHEAAKLATNPEGINAPYKEKSLRSLMSSSSDKRSTGASKGAVALLVAVAVGAGLYFLPQWETHNAGDAGGGAVAVLPEQGADEPLFMPALQTGPEAPAAEAPELASEPVAPQLNPSSQNAVPEAAATAAPQSAPAAESAAAPTAAPATGRVLRFSATGESWVQVRDAQNKVLMEKILKSGDVYEQTLALHPLQVVVGNVGATTLEIDGAAWELAATARNNVARFEVK